MCFAIGVEPTKETAWMPGWLRIASTAVLSPWITLSTPSGKPASLKSSAIRTDAEGTFSEGLRMNVLPQAIAIGNIHSGTITGKLNGVMPAQTPTGWRSVCVSTWVPTFSAYSPFSKWGMPQANSTTSMPRCTEPIASGSVLPCSSVTMRASCFWFACRSCRNFCMTRARRSGGVSRHSGKAAAAAFTAESTMPASAYTTRFVTWPVAGLNTSPWRPPGVTGLPWIQTGTTSSFNSAGLFIDASCRRVNHTRAMAALVPAKLDFRNETPYSAAFGDVYHSADGGIAQAEHVFLKGNGLPERWARRERFVILETGFGFGLNFLTTWQAWKRDASRCRRLHYVSIEKHPFTLADLRLVHERYAALAPEAKELHAHWPPLVSGGHRLEFGNVVLTLFFGDVAIVRDLRLAADAVYLDGFAPAKNPDMWTHQVMRAVSRVTASGATVATWSVAGGVRDALEATGFAVEKHAGFGGKREMLTARKTKNGDSHHFSPRERKALVVGAGLAGAAVCERLCARGWEVELHERRAEPAQEASGNHAGTFHPVVTPDDSIFARLTRAGYLHALRNWLRLGGVRYDQCGVLQLARNDKEIDAQQKSIV